MTEFLDRIRGALVGLKMPRALEALDHTMQRLEQGKINGIETINALLSEERAFVRHRSKDNGERHPGDPPDRRRPAHREAPAVQDAGRLRLRLPAVARPRAAALAQLDFRRAEVMHFLGPSGTGKSHLATALGVAAAKAGRQVYRATR